MYTKQEIIISSFRDGKSQRQIARDLQIVAKQSGSTCRNTKRYCNRQSVKKQRNRVIYPVNRSIKWLHLV
jgi:DNA-binding CsgD family transcriptional regulator